MLLRLVDIAVVAWFTSLPVPLVFCDSVPCLSPAAASRVSRLTVWSATRYTDEWVATLSLLLQFDSFRQTHYPPSHLHTIIKHVLHHAYMPPHRGLQRLVDMWLWRCSLRPVVPPEANYSSYKQGNMQKEMDTTQPNDVYSEPSPVLSTLQRQLKLYWQVQSETT